MKSLLLAFSLTLFAVSTNLAGSAPEKDPLVGRWLWDHDLIATFNADGTGSLNAGYKCSWVFTSNPEVQRKYRLVWGEGQVTDKLILSEDQKTIQVQNSQGRTFTARRPVTTP